MLWLFNNALRHSISPCIAVIGDDTAVKPAARLPVDRETADDTPVPMDDEYAVDSSAEGNDTDMMTPELSTMKRPRRRPMQLLSDTGESRVIIKYS